MALMTIGEFAERTKLSPKALRLYNRLGLVIPAQVDAATGYRLYSPEQVESARLVGLLRRLDMPLATIAAVVAMPPADAAAAIGSYWSGVEQVGAERRALADYLRRRLSGGDHTMYDIQVRSIPERKLIAINRHVDAAGTDAFFAEAFGRLRAAAPGITGIEGAPFLVFYGEVSEDSDGPIELCRPVAFDTTATAVDDLGDIQLRVEPEHDEAYIRLAAKDVAWPAMLPACDALERWVGEHDRRPMSALRQVLIADRRTATADTLICDLSIPLR